MDPQLQQLIMQAVMMAQQGGRPMGHPLSRAFGGMPMYGGVPIMPSQMFDLSGIPGLNANTTMGQMASSMLQGVLPSLMGPNFVPGQFAPTQNLFDHRYAIQHFQQRQQAMAAASAADTDTYFRMIRGIDRMRGVEYTRGGQQEAAAERMAGDFSKYVAPVLGNMFPELLDKMAGIRGSAMLMSKNIFEGGRYTFDPVTGRLGMSGQSAAAISSEVFNNLYGPGKDINAMRGLGAGRVGQLYDEMIRRGIGPSIDNKKLDKELEGLDPQAFEAAQRSFSATKITQSIEKMRGAVSAMRDIFGDMNRQNAPMVELLNGLNAMTQGGLSHMSSAELEKTVREAYATAKSSGLGIEGLLGFQGTAGQVLGQLGLNPSMAPQIAKASATYGQAYGEAGQLKNYGAIDKEMASQIDIRLRAQAAASVQAVRLAALMGFADEFVRSDGITGFGKNTEAYAISEAVRRGDKTYKYNGQLKSVYKQGTEMLGIITSGTGVNADEASMALMRSPAAAQRMIEKYGIGDIVREGSFELDIAPRFSPVVASAVATSLNRVAGLSDKAKGQLSYDIGNALLTESHNLIDTNPELFTEGNQVARNKKLAQILQSKLGGKLAGIDQNTLTNIVKNVFDSAEDFMHRPGSGYNDARSFTSLLGINRTKAFDIQRRLQQENAKTAAAQTAASGLGQANLVQRFSDYLQNLTADGGKFSDFIYTLAGGIQRSNYITPYLDELYSNKATSPNMQRSGGSDRSNYLTPYLDELYPDKATSPASETDAVKSPIRISGTLNITGNTGTIEGHIMPPIDPRG